LARKSVHTPRENDIQRRQETAEPPAFCLWGGDASFSRIQLHHETKILIEISSSISDVA
jgi:hypothetical protein